MIMLQGLCKIYFRAYPTFTNGFNTHVYHYLVENILNTLIILYGYRLY